MIPLWQRVASLHVCTGLLLCHKVLTWLVRQRAAHAAGGTLSACKNDSCCVQNADANANAASKCHSLQSDCHRMPCRHRARRAHVASGVGHQVSGHNCHELAAMILHARASADISSHTYCLCALAASSRDYAFCFGGSLRVSAPAFVAPTSICSWNKYSPQLIFASSMLRGANIQRAGSHWRPSTKAPDWICGAKVFHTDGMVPHEGREHAHCERNLEFGRRT
jgi:hypothetical protein